VEVVSANASEIGGFKEIVAHVSGQGVFAKLKFDPASTGFSACR
jgi:peptide chain release factor 1